MSIESGISLSFYHEFLDYHKILLEKQKINHSLEKNQKEKSN